MSLDNYDISGVRIDSEPFVKMRVPKDPSKSSAYFHFGGGSFHTDTHKGIVSVGCVGGPAVMVDLERIDGSEKRQFAIDPEDFVSAVLKHIGSTGEMQEGYEKAASDERDESAPILEEKPKEPVAVAPPVSVSVRRLKPSKIAAKPLVQISAPPPDYARRSISIRRPGTPPPDAPRLYPNKLYRRPVTFEWTRYQLHFWPTLEEAENPVWTIDPETNKGAWTFFYGDDLGRGRRTLSAPKTRYLRSVERWAVLKFFKEFDIETHVLQNRYGEILGMDGRPLDDKDQPLDEDID